MNHTEQPKKKLSSSNASCHRDEVLFICVESRVHGAVVPLCEAFGDRHELSLSLLLEDSCSRGHI